MVWPLILPQPVSPHVTPALLMSLFTVAFSICVSLPEGRLGGNVNGPGGVRLTEMGSGETFSTTLADLVVSVFEVAVAVAEHVLALVGAVNVIDAPDAEEFAESEPQPVAGFSPHVTPAFAKSPSTVAASDCVDPSFTATGLVAGVVMLTVNGTTVITAVDFFEPSNVEDAVIVAGQFAATDVAGVNVTFEVLAGETLTAPTEPQVPVWLTLHAMSAPAFGS